MPPTDQVITGTNGCVFGAVFPFAPYVGQNDRFQIDQFDVVVGQPAIGSFDRIIKRLMFALGEDARTGNLFWDKVFVFQHALTNSYLS